MRPVSYAPRKEKFIAGLLALFLGSFGIHKFYLNRPGWGLTYLLFCWTFIPTVISFFEGLSYFFMSDDQWDYRYNRNLYDWDE